MEILKRVTSFNLSAVIWLTSAIMFGGVALGQAPNVPVDVARMKQDTETKVRDRLNPLLQRYCPELCEVISVDADIDEEIPDGDEMGFENAFPNRGGSPLVVRKVSVNVQIDDRVDQVNRERLEKVLAVNMRPYGMTTEIIWNTIKLPNIGKSGMVLSGSTEALARKLEGRVTGELNKVIGQYCPDQCIIERIDISGQPISADEARNLAPNQVVRDEQDGSIYRVDGVGIDITMDDRLTEAARNKIASLMRSHTRFVSPVNFNIGVTAFPETYTQKREREVREEGDPYGLDKLRQMLVMFKDLAGTKEIITSTSKESSQSSVSNESKTSNTSQTAESKEISASTATSQSNTSATNTNSSSNTESSTATSNTSSNTSATNSNNSVSESSSKESQQSATATNSESKSGWLNSLSTEEMAAYGAGLLVLLGLILFVLLRYGRANRDAAALMSAGVPGVAPAGGMTTGPNGEPVAYAGGAVAGIPMVMAGAPGSPANGGAARSLGLQLKVQELKDELVDMFLQNPKVAKETFARLLKEDGVEAASKYVAVLGHMVIFELLNDPTFQRDLYELSEYYHNSNFRFSLEEEYDLLHKLKTRVTASEIRVLSRKSSEKFDFLNKLDAVKIYDLLSDEKVVVQTIVLTQLGRKMRRTVFDMFQGQRKVELMAELSRAEAIPKDYLYNVAKALEKKVRSRPEYDTENLRASDVLMDLLEKANLDEQRRLMATLQKNNPDTARSIKMQLVTLEILPYLKDGHLLELVLGMERTDLLTFLAGSPDHIRGLLLNKAPSELANSWMEDMDAMASVDEQNYRQTEIMIMNRIRSLANNGVFNLLEINEMIFAGGDGEETYQQEMPDYTSQGVERSFVAA